MVFLQLNVYNGIPLILDKQARVSSTKTINFSNKVSADNENTPAAKSNIIQTSVQRAVFIKAWPKGLPSSLEQTRKHFGGTVIPMT